MQAGFELFPSLMKKLLIGRGIVDAGPDGQLVIPDDRWFPLATWLSVFDDIKGQIGPNALFRLGTSILENPRFPPGIADVDAALQGIDVAFHASHRKGGVLMYDAATGRMLEGIGHFHYDRHRRERRIDMVCDTPYPCDLELGMVTAVASRFEPKARILHAEGPCRGEGGSACRYVVSF
jgi:hypothetical protein